MLSRFISSIPLFLGLRHQDITDMLGAYHFAFAKHKSGDALVKLGAQCENVSFILDGEAEMISYSSNKKLRVHEFVRAPFFFQPERLYGFNQHFTSELIAHSDCSTVSLTRKEMIEICNRYVIIRTNYMNIVATQLQRMLDRLWLSNDVSLRMRILRFFAAHCMHPGGEKFFYIKMTDLALELNDSRLNVSIELNKLQKQGLITLSRGKIHIPAIEQMFM